MFDPMPLITLLIGAILLYVGGRLASFTRLSESLGLGLTLGLIGIIGVFVPTGLIQWARGGDANDVFLTIAKAAGVAGLLFIAGTRFDNKKVWSFQKLMLYIIAAGVALIAITSIILVVIGKQQTSVAVTAGAIFAASSLWLTGELSNASKDERVFASAGASAVLAALAALTIHLFSVLSGLAGKVPASSVYLVVILYELVKASVFFGFAYFITTRFLMLSENRIARVRAIMAYVIINVLLFVLAVRTLGQLGAFAWAFIAGAIWNRREEGRKFAASGKSVAIALLLSFSLLPLLLQTHGRAVSNYAVMLTVIIAALLLKFVLFGISARAGGVNGRGAIGIAAASLAPVEILPVFLGVAVTTWEIGSEIYFGTLTFTILSMIAGPLVLRVVEAREISARVEERRGRNERHSTAKNRLRKNGAKRIMKNGDAVNKVLS